MIEKEPIFSRHELDLLTGKVYPANSAEDDFIQVNANVPIDDQIAREKRLDQLRVQARVAAQKFEDAGRPMGGARDD